MLRTEVRTVSTHLYIPCTPLEDHLSVPGTNYYPKFTWDTNDRLFRCDKAVYAAEQVRLDPRIPYFYAVLIAEMSLDYRPWSKGQHAIYELLRSLVNMIWAVVSQSNRSSHRIPLVFDFSSLALPGLHYM